MVGRGGMQARRQLRSVAALAAALFVCACSQGNRDSTNAAPGSAGSAAPAATASAQAGFDDLNGVNGELLIEQLAQLGVFETDS
ncbi:MAG TPA: hypothetical protein VEJ20_08570, partial [Candidatus Eremiobacteraceae bacterium]|nr:hypothetical protein [Candidatus Eremiobacteraceae bacterium]